MTRTDPSPTPAQPVIRPVTSRPVRRRVRRGTVAALTVVGLATVGAVPAYAVRDAGSHGTRTAEPAAASSAAVPLQAAKVDRVLRDPRIVESSGLARSRYTKGVLWTHNDSGGGPYLYKIARNGATLARFQVAGVPAYDWEAIASTKRRGRSFLFIGDIGDNAAQRRSIFVYRVPEPRPGTAKRVLHAKTFEFRYPDGAHDAETLMVRPGKRMRIYVVSKSRQGPGGIYVAAKHPSTRHVNTLRKVGSAPTAIPDGVFLDRNRFLLRGYTQGYLYASLGARPTQFRLPLSGESVTRAWNRHYVFVGAEGRGSQVWKVPLPR